MDVEVIDGVAVVKSNEVIINDTVSAGGSWLC